MSKAEMLKQHTEKLAEIKTRLQATQQEWHAHNKAFMAWVEAELGLAGNNNEVHLAEILTKWDQKGDQPQ